MKWFSGITWQTPVNQIGWCWLLLAALVVALILLLPDLIRNW